MLYYLLVYELGEMLELLNSYFDEFKRNIIENIENDQDVDGQYALEFGILF
jgi:hypothetical protein